MFQPEKQSGNNDTEATEKQNVSVCIRLGQCNVAAVFFIVLLSATVSS